MHLTDKEKDTLTGQIVMAWQMAYDAVVNNETNNQWRRYAELVRRSPDPESLYELCREVMEDLLPFTVMEDIPTKEDENGRYFFDFEPEEAYTLFTPTNLSYTRHLTEEEVDRRRRPDEYGFVRYIPDETGKEYGLPDNARYCVPELLYAFVHAYNTLADFLNRPKEIALQNGAFSHLIALADMNIDPRTAERIVIQESKPRRHQVGIEGIEVTTKAEPIPPTGYKWKGAYITTNLAFPGSNDDLLDQIEAKALEKVEEINRNNALDPTRDHLWQYICHLYNQGKPLEFTLPEFIKQMGMDPNNRTAATDKLYRTLHDLWAYTIVLINPDGFKVILHLIKAVGFPPKDQPEKVYKIYLEETTMRMLDIEAKMRGKLKVPATYFTIDDRHRTANAIASGFLQDESRNATRLNPTTRGAQALMNEVYPRTKDRTHYTRTQTQIKPLFRDLQYLTDKTVFAGFNFIKGKRLLSLDQARAQLTTWQDFEGVHIEAVAINPDAYQLKKERRDDHLKKAAERKAMKADNIQ